MPLPSSWVTTYDKHRLGTFLSLHHILKSAGSSVHGSTVSAGPPRGNLSWLFAARTRVCPGRPIRDSKWHSIIWTLGVGIANCARSNRRIAKPRRQNLALVYVVLFMQKRSFQNISCQTFERHQGRPWWADQRQEVEKTSRWVEYWFQMLADSFSYRFAGRWREDKLTVEHRFRDTDVYIIWILPFCEWPCSPWIHRLCEPTARKLWLTVSRAHTGCRRGLFVAFCCRLAGRDRPQHQHQICWSSRSNTSLCGKLLFDKFASRDGGCKNLVRRNSNGLHVACQLAISNGRRPFQKFGVCWLNCRDCGHRIPNPRCQNLHQVCRFAYAKPLFPESVLSAVWAAPRHECRPWCADRRHRVENTNSRVKFWFGVSPNPFSYNSARQSGAERWHPSHQLCHLCTFIISQTSSAIKNMANFRNSPISRKVQVHKKLGFAFSTSPPCGNLGRRLTARTLVLVFFQFCKIPRFRGAVVSPFLQAHHVETVVGAYRAHAGGFWRRLISYTAVIIGQYSKGWGYSLIWGGNNFICDLSWKRFVKRYALSLSTILLPPWANPAWYATQLFVLSEQ